MKKMSIIIFALFAFIFNLSLIKADCDDVKKEAMNVKQLVAEINTADLIDFEMTIYNLTENLYVVVLNDYNDEVMTYHSSDFDNNSITFSTEDTLVNIKYVIRIYSEDNSCSIEPLNTLTITTNKTNSFAQNVVCRNPYHLDICNPFYDVGDMTYEEYVKTVEEMVAELSKPFSSKVFEFLSKYYLYILVPFLLIVGIYGVRIYIFKRGKKDEE